MGISKLGSSYGFVALHRTAAAQNWRIQRAMPGRILSREPGGRNTRREGDSDSRGRNHSSGRTRRASYGAAPVVTNERSRAPRASASRSIALNVADPAAEVVRGPESRCITRLLPLRSRRLKATACTRLAATPLTL